VLEDGSLVQAQLRWKQLPPWPIQLRRVRRYMTLERDMLRDNTGGRGRSAAITTAAQPVAMLADHKEHVRRYAAVRGSQPVRHASAQHAATVLNAAMEHSGSSLARVVWTALLAAGAVAVAMLGVVVIGRSNPLLVVGTSLAGVLLIWFGSPLMKAWLWGASFIRPSFSLPR
jgi:hypothetical protein